MQKDINTAKQQEETALFASLSFTWEVPGQAQVWTVIKFPCSQGKWEIIPAGGHVAPNLALCSHPRKGSKGTGLWQVQLFAEMLRQLLMGWAVTLCEGIRFSCLDFSNTTVKSLGNKQCYISIALPERGFSSSPQTKQGNKLKKIHYYILQAQADS